jgi:hypothetical protein
LAEGCQKKGIGATSDDAIAIKKAFSIVENGICTN